jgi:sec-independent protein translocase protein TatA|tara:strand:- start:130 stop:348 length:219 start_codon:yes stop_codon:yes gene_type:complete
MDRWKNALYARRRSPGANIIILVVVIIIFGVGRLPEIGGAVGKAIRDFRKSQSSNVDDSTETETEEKKETTT